jgi:hypothetical protein
MAGCFSNEEQPVGTSKRYAEHYDRMMNDRILEAAMRDQKPTTLTPPELQLDVLPLTRTPLPEPVRAWVRYGETAIRVEARAVAWTPLAVAIVWQAPGGEHKAWVWASAVERK